MNQQFRNYMQTFSIAQAKELLWLDNNHEIKSRDAEFDGLLMQLNNKTIDTVTFHEECVKIVKEAEVVYKLSNPFMEMSIDNDLPYDKVMVVPVRDEIFELGLLAKYIATQNRMAEYYQKPFPDILAHLDQLGFKTSKERLKSLLERIQLSPAVDGQLSVAFKWQMFALEGPGSIKFDVNNWKHVIENMEQMLTNYKTEYEAELV